MGFTEICIPRQVQTGYNAGVNNVGILCVLSLMGLACVNIDGGAVELAWVVRSQSGNPLGCSKSVKLDTAQVELHVNPYGEPVAGFCTNATAYRWACIEDQGGTPFEIAAGLYEFQIAVCCQNGLVADVAVPPKALRQIGEGEVTSLNAWLVEVTTGCP